MTSARVWLIIKAIKPHDSFSIGMVWRYQALHFAPPFGRSVSTFSNAAASGQAFWVISVSVFTVPLDAAVE